MRKLRVTHKVISATISLILGIGLCTPSAQAQENPTLDKTDSQALSGYGNGSFSNPQSAATLNSRLPSIVSSRQKIQQSKNQEVSTFSRDVVEEKNQFESYVESATGKPLKIFGKDLFSNVPDTFAPLDGVQVNPDYLIGTGDELQIRGWGMVDIDVNATVDRSGAIYIPHVGSVKVAGVKYRDLQGYLKKAVGKFYSNFDMTVSIFQTRAVQVYVVGHAIRPGTYTLSAMSTLLNALFVSGGPDGSGTMRNIEVHRGGQTVATFDIYDMLLKGDKSHDIPLEDGDVIYIPEVGSLAALSGNVKVPAIFELKGASSVADLINWAGGFDSPSDQKDVIVEKNVDNTYHMIAELTADTNGIASRLSAIPVQPADIIRVISPGAIPVQVNVEKEYVKVSGEVKETGVFELRKGETLRELIARLGGVTDKGYVYATEVDRESVRRMQQAKLDEVATRFEKEIETVASQRLSGTTDKDNAAVISEQIERQRQVAREMRKIKAEGRIALELRGGEAQVKNLPDLVLQDGDSVYIPRKPGTVNVLGSVFQQSAFIYQPNRVVKDYLALAGGPTATADKSEMYLIRADGTVQGRQSRGWFGSVAGTKVNAGDTIVVPEEVDRGSFVQSLKEWTSIFYQFGLGAAGLKVLQN